MLAELPKFLTGVTKILIGSQKYKAALLKMVDLRKITKTQKILKKGITNCLIFVQRNSP